jgi:hypothetical protein
MGDNPFAIYGISSIVFTLAVEQKHSSEEILETIGDVAPHKQENIMIAAQQLRQEGMQQGRLARYAYQGLGHRQESAI